MENSRGNNRLLILLVIIGVALLLAGCGSDEDDKANEDSSAEPSGALSVSNAWVRASVPMDDSSSETDASAETDETTGAVTGAFMVIENPTNTPERLISASVSPDIASVVEVHETTLDENNVMKMRPVAGIDIPANGSVELKPGSYHIMLIDLQTTLNPGDTVTLTLTFESGTTLTVDAGVREMSS